MCLSDHKNLHASGAKQDMLCGQQSDKEKLREAEKER